MAEADTTAPTLTSLVFPSSVDVTSGGRFITVSAGARDVGLGVSSVFVIFKKSWQDQSSNDRFFRFDDNNDSFTDGISTSSEYINSTSGAGTYEIESVTVSDKAGNNRYYYTPELTQLGFQTSFTISSNAQADTTAPTLTSLSFPSSVDVTSGGRFITVSAGARDVGLGVSSVFVIFKKSWQDHSSNDRFFRFDDNNDSFTDGISTSSEYINSTSGAGTYEIESVTISDKAGNNRYYYTSELNQLGFQTSFTIIDRSLGATAYVTAPESVIEGNDTSALLSVTIKNVSTVSGTVYLSYASEGTATNGSDVSVPVYQSSFSLARNTTGDYTIALPGISILDDYIAEGTETIAVTVRVTGQIFDNGTDSTVVRIALADNDRFGTSAGEALSGTAIRDSLFGLAGDDLLQGLGGADMLDGGAGNDTLDGGSGLDTMIGRTGDDTFFVDAAGDSVIEALGEGNDRILASVSYALGAGVSVEMLTTHDAAGTAAIDFVGNAYANTLIGNAGANILNGQEGADVLVALDGNDVLIGGDGAANTLQGGTGDDTYYISAVGDSVIEFAGEGNDTVRTTLASYALGGNVENLVFTGTGAFIGVGDAVGNVIVGGSGDDILNGQDGDDILVGGSGNDVLIGGTGTNTLQGGPGNDLYYVSSTGDTIVEGAGEGFDTIATDLAAYTLSGAVEALRFVGRGAFQGTGSTAADVIAGGEGNDELRGLGGNDTLSGNAGSDYLFGGAGNDQINGGAGNDRLEGGAGADMFVFADPGIDTITDFSAGTDRILLDRTVFSGLSAGLLSPGAFVRGSTARDADDRILYNPDTGALFYDPDGIGAQAAIQFAIVSVPVGMLSAGDFLVI